MIDERKIKEAAGEYEKKCSSICRKKEQRDKKNGALFSVWNISADVAFKDGAHWAMQEFLKDLWHDIRQERIPKKGFFLIEMAIEGRIFYVSKRLPAEESNLSSYLRQGCARRWSNLEDLLKHEEGGEK